MEKLHRARYVGKNVELQTSVCLHFLMFSLYPILSGFYGGFITQAGLIKSLAIVD